MTESPFTVYFLSPITLQLIAWLLCHYFYGVNIPNDMLWEGYTYLIKYKRQLDLCTKVPALMSQGRVIDIMTFNSYSLQNYSFWKGTRIIGSSDCFR